MFFLALDTISYIHVLPLERGFFHELTRDCYTGSQEDGFVSGRSRRSVVDLVFLCSENYES